VASLSGRDFICLRFWRYRGFEACNIVNRINELRLTHPGYLPSCSLADLVRAFE
jgi:hypothetical protein